MAGPIAPARADDSPPGLAQIQPLLANRCVKCHGPIKRKAKLSLSTAAAIRFGGQSGQAISPGKPDDSLLWQKVDGDEMPPDEPLSADEKELLRRWIAAGAPGLPKEAPNEPAGADHWAFRPLSNPPVPAVHDGSRAHNAIDRFLLTALESKKLSFAPEADRRALVRRVCFDLTGLPPTIEQVEQFLADASPDAYSRMVERFLASPQYGERWGKFWLDAAGYADSNGYFDADSDRPLAFRYRDYVVRSINFDKPWDQFIREQLAGDELAGWRPGQDATPEQIELLVATHYLRNGPDGSGQSDGNPDEVRIDRYSALEGSMQIVASSLLGLTIQCCKCHEHKFEPIRQEEYYQFQAVLAPAFNLQKWLKPDERFVNATLPGELAAWEARERQRKDGAEAARRQWSEWLLAHRASGQAIFRDDFSSGSLAANWSATAPGDDGPGGSVPVNVDEKKSPGAVARDGALRIIERDSNGDRWLSTKQSFDWTPAEKGQWVQATFDLLSDKTDAKDKPAERIGFFIALHDFNDNGTTAGGNILLDGNPAGGAQVHVDYPGDDSRSAGQIGDEPYRPGRSYGVRVTNVGDGNFLLEHMVDGMPEEKSLALKAVDLPDGGFGFEYCCRRSFVVDNVLVEQGPSSGATASSDAKSLREEYRARRKQLDATLAGLAREEPRPGKIAWLADVSATPPPVHLLTRGTYGAPATAVEPTPFHVLTDPGEKFAPQPPSGGESTGTRLAWARWLTRPGSRPAALLARVQSNRVWQQHFGAGLVSTPANFGFSGAPPTNPELLDYLAGYLVESGWSVKSLHRLIVHSAAYRQGNSADEAVRRGDADGKLLARRQPRRLEAEALRDAMLAVSGELDLRPGGPYVPTQRKDGEVLLDEGRPDAHRRALYLQQRRSQVLSMLQLFDAPTIVFNCPERAASTTPLQALNLLNSQFVVSRAENFARRVLEHAGAYPASQVTLAYQLALGRPPQPSESARALLFLSASDLPPAQSVPQPTTPRQPLIDFCHALLACNEFLYVD